METIFNRKIIFQRKQKINFDNSLYKTTEKQIFDVKQVHLTWLYVIIIISFKHKGNK